MKPTSKVAQTKRNVKSAPLKKTQKPSKSPKANGTSSFERKWADVSLDDFINSNSDEDDEEMSQEESDDVSEDEVRDDDQSDGGDVDDEDENGDVGNEGEEASDSADGEESDEEDDVEAAEAHKKTLEKLKTTDPDFYKFLSENDKELLEFDTSDDSEDEAGGKVHEPPASLEEASDDSDFEDGPSAAKRPANLITQAMVDNWQRELEESNVQTIATVVEAFRSAVQSVTEESTVATKFKVLGGAAFNSVVRLCIVHLIPALRRILKVPQDEKINVENCKKWVKIRTQVKLYLADVIRLMSTLTESSLLSVLLKHVHQLIPFYSAFIKLSKVLCKRLVALWSSSEDTVRVLAFLSVLRLARTRPSQLLEFVIKAMYLSYAKNCKFTSPSTWPVINFMRRSLVEILALQEALTYRHAFLYIRQLAIHLRNAITLKKKDSISTVYNWQFVHCVHLWAALLSAVPDSQLLRPLLYPLVQIAMGTINLVPTCRYYPLRFHLVSVLSRLSAATGVFIPVSPFLMEILQNHKFDKKPSKVSMKPLDLSCVLRVSQSQMAESGFRDAIIESLYDTLLEALQFQSRSVAFPEVSLPVVLQLKQFVKKCPLANYTKKMKQLMEKIQETVQFVEKQRSQMAFDLTDTKAVLALENQIKSTGTPLMTYYASWKKMRDRETAIKMARMPEDEREKIPFLKKTCAEKSDEKETGDDFGGLFPSDDSDEEDDDERFLPKEERGTKRKAEEKHGAKEKKKGSEKPSTSVDGTEATDKSGRTPASEAAKAAKKAKVDEAEDDPADEVEDFDMSDDEDETEDEMEDADGDDSDEDDSDV